MPSVESYADASPTFFRRFSAELTRLATDLDAFQNILVMLTKASTDTDATIHAQRLDELVQRAHALAGVADHMTIEAPSSAAAIERIVGAIGLRSLAASLSGEAPAPIAEEGEFHLF
jgi:hypothetical protein